MKSGHLGPDPIQPIPPENRNLADIVVNNQNRISVLAPSPASLPPLPNSNTTDLLAQAQIITLNPRDIYVADRIGFLHEDKAVALGRLMAVDGQRDPIKVRANGQLENENLRQKWQLVTGMHRMRGAELEGIVVYALEVSANDSDAADLEASENLHRRPLGPIERAKFTAALVQAAQDRIAREHGDISHQKLGAKARWDRVKHGEARPQEALKDDTQDACANFAQAYGWEESVGDALGMSRRTIHNDLTLYKLLIAPFPELIEALSNHPVVGENGRQLKSITQVKNEAARRAVIEMLLADHTLNTDMARAALGIDQEKPTAPSNDARFTSTISNNWERLSMAGKREYLPRFLGLLSDDMRARLQDLLANNDQSTRAKSSV